jgi:predicted solute-binding protein
VANKPLAIVGVSFLNARPLLAGLEAGIPGPIPYTFSTAEPAQCAQLLGENQAQVGLVPVAALAHLPEVHAFPHWGVVAQRETTSVLLLTKVPLPEIRLLAAHKASRTSVILAQLLLATLHGVRPKVVAASPPAEAMLAQADAAVIIGDPALAWKRRPGIYEWDLAAEWMRLTGRPFVFALWGARPQVDGALGQLLERSLAYAEAHWSELLPQWAREHGLALERTREYLETRLRFRLQEAERQAVEEFLRLAHQFQLLPPREEVWRHE